MPKFKKKKKKQQEEPKQDEIFNFDNEIVIGVTVPKEQIKTKNKKTKKQTKKNNKSNGAGLKSAQNKIVNNKKKNNTNEEIKVRAVESNIKQSKIKSKKTFVKRFIKWLILLIALIVALLFFLLSPLFNIAQIQVINNEKISNETIISLSKLQIGENIYKKTKSSIKSQIKENAYIEDVTIKRKLPNIIEISVKERNATYMLEYANSYAYINNQGYILEISEEKLEVPIIIGYTTKEEDIKPGLRLCENDLERIQTVLKIMEVANSNGIGKYITKINITDKQNYTLTMEEKKKTAYLGDASNLSNRILYLKAILLDEEGIEGEIFLNMDLNKEKAFFRKKE